MAGFENMYASLGVKEQNDFARAVNYLLNKCFVVSSTFDNREKIFKDNQIYKFIDLHFDMILDYLSFSGWLLERDYQKGVIYLQNLREENLLKFDRFSSVVIFILRIIYEREMNNNATGSLSVKITTVSIARYLIEEFGITQISGRKIFKSGTSFKETFRLLVNRNIIEKLSGSFDDGSATINILPSITFIIDDDSIRNMENILKELSLKNDSPLEGDY
ncbi:MAG: DUF4194 domain-containing protein [Erysipelotrichaceae bacterium]|jgi:hypothetical protein|nr:DUF4194 domain-containing protein [Erysipelotrichaceae bacterium]